MNRPPEMMRHLEAAKKGSAQSAGRVCEYVWKQYGRAKVAKVFSLDPADDYDDLKQVFMMGVYEHLPKLDHRGNPLYHLSVRGWYALSAYTRRSRKFSNLDTLEDSHEIVGSREARSFDEDLCEKLGAAQVIAKIEAEVEMSPSATKVYQVIKSGHLETGVGFNRRLAGELGVSPQRASQAQATLRKQIINQGVEV